ncbi:hypothetical protein B0J13DRAFT_569391 [Dactylonectria estremocensis]|uniref:Uncharacterized protein n=1 Tax=Dactylonectria estremocensis TaxID=1079267 RepID=A0A9P9DGG7_9HYPO|nr:hypothetical protein B0J13DRAFT_569391 [Dactylonectria estremocensis]
MLPGENVWRQGVQPTKCPALPKPSDADIVAIVANADKVRECPSCRDAFTKTFRMPEMWWTTYSRKSNGYFGCETISDDLGGILEINSWARFLVKVLDGESQDRYKWYKLNAFVQWVAATQQTIILFFDPPPAMKMNIPNQILTNPRLDHLLDPFWAYTRLVEDVVSMQDVAVWTTRGHVRYTEKHRMTSLPPTPNYSKLHDLSRHIIHNTETLDLAVKTVGNMLQQHSLLMDDLATILSRKAAHRSVHERLLFLEHMFQSLQCRSSSNKERLQNEIQLAFNVVAEYDAEISLQIGRATQSDSAAMKTIAFLTMAFLPATFISAIFSTSFFSNDNGGWAVSSKMWVYWAFAIPVTVLTCLLWYYWQRNLAKAWASKNVGGGGGLQLRAMSS